MHVLIFPVPGVEIPNQNTEFPPGLILLKDYITPDCEQALIDCINWEDTDENISKGMRNVNLQYEFRLSLHSAIAFLQF